MRSEKLRAEFLDPLLDIRQMGMDSFLADQRVLGKIELIGFNDPTTGQIRIPRRPLDPGAKVLVLPASLSEAIS